MQECKNTQAGKLRLGICRLLYGHGMRLLPCLLIMLPLLGSAEDKPTIPGAGQPAVEAKTLFVNSKVSARVIALNQTVRLEFITVPRQVENVDVAAAVAGGIALGAASTWRVVGPVTVTVPDKTRTVGVAVSLQPRISGEVRLPQFPLTWLSGAPLPDLGMVTVQAQLLVGGELKPLPVEVESVSGYAWGMTLAVAVARGGSASAGVLQPRPGLSLAFPGGLLTSAELLVEDLPLDQARTAFLQRWGLPSGSVDQPEWRIGWLRIAASAAGNGTRVNLEREDLSGKAANAQVHDRIFGVLESPIAR